MLEAVEVCDLQRVAFSSSLVLSLSLCRAESFNSVRWARAQDCRPHLHTNQLSLLPPVRLLSHLQSNRHQDISNTLTDMSSSVEMCGGELVCRLVAATPPYLYSPAGLPHCFFFSELLRGLVEARAKRPASPPPSISAHQKRFRLAGPDSAFSTPHCHPSSRKNSNSKENMLSTSHILPYLQQIYTTIGEQKRKEPLPAVIGLELVVDYVKHERKEPKQ